MKFEYQIVELDLDKLGKTEATNRLLFLGKQGWEAYGVTSNAAGVDRVWMKREIGK